MWFSPGIRGRIWLLACAVSVAGAADRRDAQWEKHLARPVSWRADGSRTVGDLLDDLHRQTGAPIRTSNLLASVPNVGLNQRLDESYRQVPLEAVLDRALSSAGLDWTVADGEIFVARKEVIGQLTSTRVYRLDRFTPRVNSSAALATVIRLKVHPESWEAAGGQGLVYAHDGRLVVTQTWRVHRDINRMLPLLVQRGATVVETATRRRPDADDAARPEALAQIEKSYALSHLFDSAADREAFSELIEVVVYPDSWENVGGPGQIEVRESDLRVRHSPAIHRIVSGLLEAVTTMSNSSDRQSVVAVTAEDEALRKSLPRLWELEVPAFEFRGQSIRQVLASLAKSSGISVGVDTEALENIGVSLDDPIYARNRDLPLRYVLTHLLHAHGMRAVPLANGIQVTSVDSYETTQTIWLYDVRNLTTLDGRLQPKHAALLADDLMDVLSTTVAPDTWDDVGGECSIEAIPGGQLLVVRQTWDNQEYIAAALRSLRVARQRALANDFSQTALRSEATPVSPELTRALERPARLGNGERPLGVLVQQLQRMGLAVNLSPHLDELDVSEDTPVVIRASHRRLLDTLRSACRDHDMALWTRGELATFMPPEEVEVDLPWAAYPVRDLVQPRGAPPAANREGDEEISRLVAADYASLPKLIRAVIAPDTWDDVGGFGAAEPVRAASCLVIAQADEHHEKVEQLLTTLRRFHRLPKLDGANAQWLGTATERQLCDQLLALQLPLGRTTISGLLGALTQRGLGPLAIDEPALEELGLDADSRLTITARGLNAAMRDLGIAFAVQDDEIRITEEERPGTLAIRVYPLPKRLAGIQLSDLILKRLAPDSWDEVGGAGTALKWNSLLIISNTIDVHREVAAMLKDSRQP